MTRRVVSLATAIVAGCLMAGAAHGVAAQGAATGTIVGHVHMTGPAVANAIIRMGADPLCGKINAGKRRIQEVVLKSASGGLANAFVSLQGTFKPTPVPSTPVVINQEGCVYGPRVLGARVGQALQIKNSDTTVHNAHSQSTHGNDFNTSQPKPGMVYTFQLKNEDVMMRLKCDIHSWMAAYVGVMTHPYFSVSDGEGAFTIANVPAGSYTIRSWHERYGLQMKTVVVKAGQTATADLTYTGTEKPDAARLQELVLPAGVMAAMFGGPGDSTR